MKADKTYYDCKGVPIMEGDLIRMFHFRDTRRRIHYLYHAIRKRDGYLEAVPIVELATGKKDGGCFWIHAHSVDDICSEQDLTVIDGRLCVCDRRKIPLPQKAGAV